MLLPIYAYGQPVLKKVALDITPEHPNLKELISNMWDTMYEAHGVGLAAPQIGQSIRLFIIDSEQIEKEDNLDHVGFKKVFINAHKVEEKGEKWGYDEGCLSIPNIRSEVIRKAPTILVHIWTSCSYMNLLTTTKANRRSAA